MATDAQAASAFYASPRGVVAARMLRTCLDRVWPSIGGDEILGLGYAGPFLRPWRDRAYRCVAVPTDCGVEEDALPFPDLTFDRILLVHGLETADNARALLRECWRVLKDSGRLVAVVPNRTGIWAYAEGTPFGHGHPYSEGQLSRLLAANLFRVERFDAALWVPPLRMRPVLRSAPAIERVGRRVFPGLAGVTVAEAVKDIYAAMPVRAVARRRLVAVEA